MREYRLIEIQCIPPFDKEEWNHIALIEAEINEQGKVETWSQPVKWVGENLNELQLMIDAFERARSKPLLQGKYTKKGLVIIRRVKSP